MDDADPTDWSSDFIAQYTAKDLILYALATGFGAREDERRYVYERHENFTAISSFCFVLSFWASQDKHAGSSHRLQVFPPPMMRVLGVLPRKFLLQGNLPESLPVIHTFQSVTWYQPLPVPRIDANSSETNDVPIVTRLKSRTTSVIPKTIGTFVTSETKIQLDGNNTDNDNDNDNDTPLCIMQITSLLLGMPPENVVAFGEQRQKKQSASWTSADALPTFEWTYATTPTQALLYRIASGDSNAIHVDPNTKALLASDKPILHGLCTLAIAVRGFICFKKGVILRHLECRFTRPACVGDVLVVRLWDGQHQSTSFQVVNQRTGDVIVDKGLITYGIDGSSEAKM